MASIKVLFKKNWPATLRSCPYLRAPSSHSEFCLSKWASARIETIISKVRVDNEFFDCSIACWSTPHALHLPFPSLLFLVTIDAALRSVTSSSTDVKGSCSLEYFRTCKSGQKWVKKMNRKYSSEQDRRREAICCVLVYDENLNRLTLKENK